MDTNKSDHDRAPEHECPICKETVNQDAKKCIRCNSYIAGWRQYVDVGNTSLALIIALLSVVGSVIPSVYSTIQTHRDDLRINLIGVGIGGQSASIVCANLGDRPGAIARADIVTPPKIAASTSVPGWSLDLPEVTVVRPGETLQMKLESGSKALPVMLESIDVGEQYDLRIELVRYSGKREIITIPFKGRPR